jgi:flagellar motor switch protein FliG
MDAEVEEEESIQDRYRRMSRIQKLALLMIALGPQASATLLKRFEPKDSENICKEIGNFPIVDQELQDCVLDEFSEIIESSVSSNLGGMAFAQKTLELAHGDYRANNMMNRIAPVRESLDFMDDVNEMESGQIYNVLRFEQPQTIAFVLANVDSDKSSEVLLMMAPHIQEQVIERIGSMETTPAEQVQLVADTLGQRMSKKEQSPRVKTGGVKAAADLLNWFGKDDGKELLKNLEKRNPKLGSSIRQRMFRFEDLVRLSPGDVGKVVKEVDQDDLIVALKNAPHELKKLIYTTMSKRAVEALEEQLEFLGPKRLSEVEAAQDRVIQVVRELEEDEEIILDTGGGDVVVQ